MAYWASNQWSRKLMAMAEPLPHPSEDTPKKPNPNAPPSSPYLPGKGPGSKDDKLVHAVPGEHGHPGGMGFEQKVVPQRQDLIINEGDATEGVKFPMPIRGGGDGKEHPMIAPQTTPDTPDLGILAQKGVDYTSPHPKFDAHMKNTPPMSKPDQRIKHLNEGVRIRQA